MRGSRLGALCVLGAVIVAAIAGGVASAAVNPSATASHGFAAGSPAAIECAGFVDVRATITGHAGTSGQATDVILVLDISGSMGSPASKFADLKRAATDSLDSLDAADGAVDQSIAGNRVGIVTYRGSTATLSTALGSTYSTLVNAVTTLPAPTGGSPHALAISTASSTLSASASGLAKAMVLVTDGQATGSALTNATAEATLAKQNGIRIVPIGIGTGADVSQTNLETWATPATPSSYQSGSPGPISKTKLVADLGAAVAVPVSFTLTETLGANFAATIPNASTGSVVPGTGTLVWTGTLADNQTATLDFRATRNGADVFAVASEVVSTLTLSVTGGTATVTPPGSISIDVLPCGGTLLNTTTCTGAQCTSTGTQGGIQYTLNAGTPPAGTTTFLTGLNEAPPAGVCSGFDAKTNGVQFDIRPLTTDADFQIVIPKAALGTKKWWQTGVCLGTNMKFTTAIDSLANLRPGAKLAGGGTLPSRWWGLLPSIPRFVQIPGLGRVRGPWITSRSQDAAGNAVIKFRVPYIPGSAPYTTDGKAAYDPKCWG